MVRRARLAPIRSERNARSDVTEDVRRVA